MKLAISFAITVFLLIGAVVIMYIQFNVEGSFMDRFRARNESVWTLLPGMLMAKLTWELWKNRNGTTR